jgi:hypothetical protein
MTLKFSNGRVSFYDDAQTNESGKGKYMFDERDIIKLPDPFEFQEWCIDNRI